MFHGVAISHVVSTSAFRRLYPRRGSVDMFFSAEAAVAGHPRQRSLETEQNLAVIGATRPEFPHRGTNEMAQSSMGVSASGTGVPDSGTGGVVGVSRRCAQRRAGRRDAGRPGQQSAPGAHVAPVPEQHPGTQMNADPIPPP